MRKGVGYKMEYKNMTKTLKKTEKQAKTDENTKKQAKTPNSKALITKEENRILKYLKNKAMDDDKLNIALDLVKDIAFMTVKTAELKKEIELYGMTEEYQNGATQKGRKKSACFEAYLNMTKQKSSLIKQLTDLLPIDSYIPTDPNEGKDEFDRFLEQRKR